jgi:preprotein translocase subunit SecD
LYPFYLESLTRFAVYPKKIACLEVGEMFKRAWILLFILIAAAGWLCVPAAPATKSDRSLNLEIKIQSPSTAPVTPLQLEKTRKVIAAQLAELQKSLNFQYRLEQRPPATLTLRITAIKDLAAREILLRNIAPPRGKVRIYLLPSRYSLVIPPAKDNQRPQYLFLDKKRNQRQTGAGKVLGESKVVFQAEDLRPMPKIKVFPSPGKSDRWMITYTFLPEPGARFSEFTRSHKGRNLALVIDGKIIAAPKIISRIAGGQLVLSLSPPFEENSPEARRLKRELNKRPLPLPVVVKEIKMQD